MAGMSQSAPSDLFARPKARRSEDGGQEECHGRAGLGRSPGVAGAVWDGSGLPWVIFQPVRHEGCQHLGPARLMWPEPQHLWAFPPGLRHRECLGTFPTCPKTLRSLLQGCHGRAGTLAGPGPAVARRPVQGAGSSWGCGKVGLWTIIDASSPASVVILHTYPHLFSPLLSGHHLPSHSRWQPDPLHWRFIEPPEHQTQGAWTPVSHHAWGSRHTWLHRHERREALRGRRLPRIPRLINRRVGL